MSLWICKNCIISQRQKRKLILPWLKCVANRKREVVNLLPKGLHVTRPRAEWDESGWGKGAVGIDQMDWVVCLISSGLSINWKDGLPGGQKHHISLDGLLELSHILDHGQLKKHFGSIQDPSTPSSDGLYLFIFFL